MSRSRKDPGFEGFDEPAPPPSESEDITRILERAAREGEEAVKAVLPLVYPQLRALARARLRALPPGETLQATALVHEAYLRISRKPSQDWEGRRHILFAASRAMRDILIESARKKQALKRGGKRRRTPIEDLPLALETPSEDILALDEALEELREQDPQGHALVTLRYYGGLTMKEIADLQETPLRTVERRWRFLRAWLADRIQA